MRHLSFTKFIKKYGPIPSISSKHNYMIETTDVEGLEHVNNKREQYIWSIVEDREKGCILVTGRSTVNLLGYIITTIPFKNYYEEYIVIGNKSKL